MRRVLLSTFMAFLVCVSVDGQKNNDTKRSDAESAAPAAQMTIRPVPPDIVKRSESLRASLQPSAKTWIDQQAQIEAKRAVPNPDALRTAIRQRFNDSLAQKVSRAVGTPVGQIDVDAVVIIVLEEAAQDGAQDLQAQMQQAQATMNAKQAMRQLLDELEQNTAQLQTGAKTAACKTPFCQSLPSKLAELNRSSAMLSHPIHLQAPENPTGQQLALLDAQIKQALDSLNDMSSQMQTEVQTLMDARSKLL